MHKGTVRLDISLAQWELQLASSNLQVDTNKNYPTKTWEMNVTKKSLKL